MDEPLGAPVYELDWLLDQITPETVQEEIDFGAPVGNEIIDD